MENQNRPEYKAISQHQGDLKRIVRANISSIIPKLHEKELITRDQSDNFSESKDAKALVDDCILLTIEMAEADRALVLYLEIMSVLRSCVAGTFQQFLGRIEDKRRELYREIFSPRATGPNVGKCQCQVFISYVREETTNTMVDTIKQRLKEQKLTVFVDRSNLNPGDHWPAELMSAIHTSPVFIAVLTKKYASSYFCHGELYEAQALGKSLFPVMLENGWDKEIAGKAVKEIVKDFQYTFVQPGEDIEKNLDKLVKSIAAKFDLPRPSAQHNYLPHSVEASPVGKKSTSAVDNLLQMYGLSNSAIDQNCSYQHILEIYQYMEKWELVAVHLGLKTADIEAIKHNATHNFELMRLYALKKWQSIGLLTGTATYRVLIEALLKCGGSESAMQLCELLKKDK